MKRRMITNTKFIIIAGMIIIAFLISYSSRYDYIDDFNNNIDMHKLKFLDIEENVKGIIEKEFEYVGGMGGNFYDSLNKETTIVFGGFPDVKDSWKLIRVITMDDNYSFYGITVGDDEKSVVNILKENGFQQLKSYEFLKEKIYICLYFDERNTLIKTDVQLLSTNKEGVVY